MKLRAKPMQLAKYDAAEPFHVLNMGPMPLFGLRLAVDTLSPNLEWADGVWRQLAKYDDAEPFHVLHMGPMIVMVQCQISTQALNLARRQSKCMLCFIRIDCIVAEFCTLIAIDAQLMPGAVRTEIRGLYSLRSSGVRVGLESKLRFKPPRPILIGKMCFQGGLGDFKKATIYYATIKQIQLLHWLKEGDNSSAWRWSSIGGRLGRKVSSKLSPANPFANFNFQISNLYSPPRAASCQQLELK